ncbi:glycosyltransferase, partial [Bacillus cereus]|uniref:glycosyltransferase n=1 Tax=Bacillus cereus TaxID=1396 RepID=UPI00345BA482
MIHKENGGLSSARNAGLEIASGEYVMFIDADDVVHSKMLETELKVLKEENADIFICGLKHFAEIEEVDTCAELQIKNCVEIQSGLEIE